MSLYGTEWRERVYGLSKHIKAGFRHFSGRLTIQISGVKITAVGSQNWVAERILRICKYINFLWKQAKTFNPFFQQAFKNVFKTICVLQNTLISFLRPEIKYSSRDTIP